MPRRFVDTEVVMKKPRWTRWRWLLALLLGVGTWWGVGWWLLPKAWFEASYPLTIAGRKAGQGIDSTDLPETFARIYDRQGQYLYLEQPSNVAQNQYQLIDLSTRRIVANHVHQQNTLLEQTHQCKFDMWGTYADRNGLAHMLIHHYKDGHPEELWEWNAFANTITLKRTFPKATRLWMSSDGSALMEIQKQTPLMPCLMLLPSL